MLNQLPLKGLLLRLLLPFLLLQATVFGQAITTSALDGSIQSDQGDPVAGATVTVVHEPTGSRATTTSRGDGSFVVRGLRPGGPYTVTSQGAGHSPAELREVYLDIDRGASVVLRLPREEVVQMERFEITSSAVDQMFDTTQTGSGSYVTSQAIRELPAGDRSINSLARLDPRITYNRDPQDRAISVSGISNRYNSIQVDGVSASDPFGLNANNTAAERNVIPLDSLEALAINTSPYNARNGGFVGAQINAITKSGTNEFHGSVYYTYRGRSAFGGVDLVGIEMDGRDYALSNFSEETIGATLNGPIIPNKLFFALTYETVDEQRVAPSPAARVAQTTIDQIVSAATALGFDIGSAEPPSANKLKDDNVIAKLDWEINSDHRATFRYNNSESSRPTFEGFGSGISENNFSFSSSWYAQEVQNESFMAQLVSRWSDRLDTEVTLSRSEYHSEPRNNTRQPAVRIRSVPVPGSSNSAFVDFGTQISRHANVLDVATDTADLFASFELNDAHTLQAGLQYEQADVYNLFVQSALGNYEFNSLDQFLAVAANNNGTVNYRQYTYNAFNPGVSPAAEFKEQNVGLYLNDQWRVNPSLRVDLGVRVDVPYLPDSIPYNASLEAAFGVRNDATYDGEKVFQPRFGFNWQPEFDEKRTVIRGGFGLFYGRAPRVWISNSYSNTGSNFRTYTAGTQVGNTQAPAVSANPDAQPTTGSLPPAQTVAFMDPNFELPATWKGNLAIERELGFWDLKVTAEIEKAWFDKNIFYENINLAPTGTASDGRVLYFNAYGSGTNPNASGTRLVNTSFTNRLMRLTNTDQGENQSIMLSVERPRKRDGWYWRASYVNTDASEVMLGTSSIATSNWNNRAVFNPNEQLEHRSELEVQHKFLVDLSKQFTLIRGAPTTVSLFYEGRSGYPFSFIVQGDINGDSLNQNDLPYIPRRDGDPLVRFATPADRDNFFRIVDRFGLPEGEVLSANSNRYPWVNQFDLGIKQEVPLPGWRHRLVLGVDVLNVGNLLNDKWGLIRGSNQFFVKREGLAFAAYDGQANQYVYSGVPAALAEGTDFNPSLGRGEPAASRWSVLFSARYEF